MPAGERAACQFPGIVEAAQHLIDDRLAQLADQDHVPLAEMETNPGAFNEIPHGSEQRWGDKEEPTLLPLDLDRDLNAACERVGNRIVNAIMEHFHRLQSGATQVSIWKRHFRIWLKRGSPG